MQLPFVLAHGVNPAFYVRRNTTMGLLHGSLLAWLILLLIPLQSLVIFRLHWAFLTGSCNGKEVSGLTKIDTWQLVSPVFGVNVIDSKWVFKVKRHADGSIERYKA